MVSDWRQHCDETAAPIRQRKNTEFVEDVHYVGNRGEEPVEVFHVDALGEEGDDCKEVMRVGAEAAEGGGSKREFDGRRKAFVVFRLKDPRPLDIPLLGQSIVIPCIMRCGGSEQCDGEGVEIQAFKKVVDDVRPPVAAIDAVEDTARCLHRQCGNFWTLAPRRDSCDTGSDEEGYR